MLTLRCAGSLTGTVMRALEWFLQTFPTPRRVRERREQLRAERESRASAWAARYFDPRMEPAARSVALAFSEVEGVGVLDQGPSSRLMDDLHMTDLEPVQVVLGIEELLNIKIPDKEAENLLTMSDWVRYVYAKLPAHPA